MSELLASILLLLSITESEPSQHEVFRLLEKPHTDAFRTAAVIWKWLVERNDFSVGSGREYNDVPLSKILALAQKPPIAGSSAHAQAPGTNGQTKHGLRVHVSESTMWESLAGHGVDHKRIPRSEWILLQGIASTTSKGILQGDLGRLVGQDKRSVPKRTGCLVEKGYITKRTTLVRGTKTSKLWLKFLAPSAPEESSDGREAETAVTFSRHCLIDSLEAVPWHTRWTGDSIDYRVLANTIMALCKEWNVMRLQDLKSKLGVLGMTWQMKVVSKICRFLNARGTIQYVAAKLNNRIFKDCIRFNREMNARDWSIFLATGKRTTKSTKNLTQEHGDEETSMIGAPQSGFEESHCPSWSIYIPITSLVALCIQESGSEGITNPQLCAMTIGPGFTRYLAGLTASISSDNIQPSNVKYLAVKSERGRPGKSSSLYWYFMEPSDVLQHDTSEEPNHPKSKVKSTAKSSNLFGPYNFAPLGNRSNTSAQISTLSDLCQRGLSQQKRRGRPKKIKSEPRANPLGSPFRDSTLVEHSASRALGSPSRSAVVENEGERAANDQRTEAEIHEAATGVGFLNEETNDQVSKPAIRVRGRPRTRGGGEAGRKTPTSKTQVSNNRQFTCEKCSGSWKNDVGLKYHLEKSQTPCNPSFKPQLMAAPKRKSGFASNSSQPRRSAKKAFSGDSDDLPALGSGGGVESTDSDLTNKSRSGSRRFTTSSMKKKRFDDPESLNIDEDISILSGQAQLLATATAVLPRQVDPFTKPPVRQSAAPDNINETLETEYAGHATSVPDSRDAASEVSQAHPAAGDSIPADLASVSERMGRTPGKPSTKGSIRQELMNFITELLYQHSGALPAGPSLEILVSETWKSRPGGEDVPSGARIKSVMLQMIREKKIVDQWHAFKAPDGRIGKCHIITIPSVMAFAPETRNLVETIRQLYPANILPHQIPGVPRMPEVEANPKQEDEEQQEAEEEAADETKPTRYENRVGGRGRRPLAAGVAILNAPVYAAQVAAKRAAESEDVENSPEKRRRIDGEIYTNTEDNWDERFWPVAGIPPPSSHIQQFPSPIRAGFSLDILFSSAIRNCQNTTETGAPFWARDGVTHSFEHLSKSMQQEGWIEESAWFSWMSHHDGSPQSITPRDRSQFNYFVEKLKFCLNIEIEADYSIQFPFQAGGVFINFLGGDAGDHIQVPEIQWSKSEKRRNTAAKAIMKADEDESGFSSASADEGPELPPDAPHTLHGFSNAATSQATSTPVKRAVLASRNLTSLPLDLEEQGLTAQHTSVDNNELVAAFVVIRSLLGGVDKIIDWGLLAHLFPTVGLPSLRRFWAKIRKEKASLLSKATQDFQESLIIALQNDEIAIPDYERPLDYDWTYLIQWAMRHPNQEQLHLPFSREEFHRDFKLEDGNAYHEDWKEKMFHPQSSVYSRFEVATLHSGTLTATEVRQMSDFQPTLSTVEIARSWIRSLCCTSETEYTPQDVKERFSLLSHDTPQQNTAVLKTAIDELTKERVICKSKRTPFGGRPYRLNEGYSSVLTKVAHRQKYLDAVAFKKGLDEAFQSNKTMKVPYTLSDGAMMALINLIACERIRITAETIPNIPFGFEPGNYESRKYPKSYYHLDLDIEPTQSYLFNNDIEILEVIQRTGAPRGGRDREIPQWIDFFGKLDEQRWADILGAVCFAFNTRGIMSIAGICDAVMPILDTFEARIIVAWGLNVGVFVKAGNSDIALGEWWWLIAQRLGE